MTYKIEVDFHGEKTNLFGLKKVFIEPGMKSEPDLVTRNLTEGKIVLVSPSYNYLVVEVEA